MSQTIAVNSPHRSDAFAAASFIMDLSKTNTLFWKNKITASGEKWIETKESDAVAKKEWP
jgi:molybdopterin synthase catalytic subunit